jgi:hypothetical protein
VRFVDPDAFVAWLTPEWCVEVSHPRLLSRHVCRKSSITELITIVFVAGATAAIGKQLVPCQVAGGHEDHGMTRRESKQVVRKRKFPLVGNGGGGWSFIHFMTEIGGASSANAEREFGWPRRTRAGRRGLVAA